MSDAGSVWRRTPAIVGLVATLLSIGGDLRAQRVSPRETVHILAPAGWRAAPAQPVTVLPGEAIRIEGLALHPAGVRAIEIDGVRASFRSESSDSQTVRFVGYASPDSAYRETAITVHGLTGAPITRTFPLAVAPADRGLQASASSSARRPRGDKWAVVIGISSYRDPDIPDLQYANADARAFYDFLLSERSGGGFTREKTQLLLDSAATHARIRWALRRFLEKATEDDVVVIYFAGHGLPNPDRLDELYLAPFNVEANDIASTGIPMTDVGDATRRIYAHDILVIVDACHSAGAANVSGRRGVALPNAINREFLERLETSAGGLVVFTASQALELSKEGREWGGGHGVFTHFILEALNGAADEDANGIVTLGEMHEWVRASVRRATGGTQTPTISSTSFDPTWPLSIAPRAGTGTAANPGSASDSGGRTAPLTTSSEGRPAQSAAADSRSRTGMVATLLVIGILGSVGLLAAFRLRRRFRVPVARRAGTPNVPSPQTPPPTHAPETSPRAGPESTPEPAALGTFAERYTTERELARGTFTTSYLARDVRMQRRVIVKTIHHETPISEKDKQRFEREIKILSTLNHPGIIPIHDIGVEGESVFAVMPYLPGESLRARLARESPLAVGDAVRIAVDVADALDHAHRRGIVHRGVRPESIVLSGGRALLGDFGLARAVAPGVDGVTTVGSAQAGPPDYLSPEQMLPGFELDGRTDIYSLGVVLFEMLTGTVPFRGVDGNVNKSAKYSGPPPAASTLKADLPAWVNDVLTKALAPYPERRFGSAIELASALRAHVV